MAPVTLARKTLYGATMDKLDPFTFRTVTALVRQAGFEIVEQNTVTTRTLLLQRVATFTPTMENENQPLAEPSESFADGDGHHDLARYRLSGAEIGTDEGDE